VELTLSRRNFLRLTLAGFIVGIPSLSLVAHNRRVAVITEVLRENLSYLTLDEAGLTRFAEEYLDKQKIEGFWAVERLYRRDQAEIHNITTLYLMSSDFFWRDADTSRVVQYRSYYNPYSGCSNPFAVLR
jgi:hypothetical protein